MKDNSETMQGIFQETIQRYSSRYRKLEYNVRTLGWGTREQQQYRFMQTILGGTDFNNKSVLDIGCGFADYMMFLENSNISVASYTGWDLNPDLIEEARKVVGASGNVRLEIKNIFDVQDIRTPFVDIGIMLGVLNFNLKETFDNYEYSRLAIMNAFQLVREVLIVDFLSSYTTESYEKEDFVFYHNPEAMLEYALSLSPNVVLRHNYQPIPQKEFMLYIYR